MPDPKRCVECEERFHRSLAQIEVNDGEGVEDWDCPQCGVHLAWWMLIEMAMSWTEEASVVAERLVRSVYEQ